MPPEELKTIKERVAIVMAAINKAEVSNAGGKKILSLWSKKGFAPRFSRRLPAPG
jgi:hypothetical protein